MQKPQGGEVPLIANLNNPPMEQTANTTSTQGSSHCHICHSTNKRGNPMAQHCSSLNKFICCQIMANSPNENEIPIPAFIKMEDRPNAESAYTKAGSNPQPMALGNSAHNNKSLSNVPSEELCGWGPQCPICAQSALNLKTEDSNWEEEDWNGDKQKAKEEEKQKKGRPVEKKICS